MAGGIIHIDSAEAAIALTARPYDSEKFLQQEIAKHDGLLGGDQFDPPKRWLFVSREMGVPAKQDGGSKWSLDHLFIDQHAIPTFVEVKKSSNKEIRRKIVGQMLDYAANANKYWSIKAIRDAFEKTCKQLGKDAEARLLEFLNCEDTGEDDDDEVEEGSPTAGFWNDVEANLQDVVDGTRSLSIRIGLRQL